MSVGLGAALGLLGLHALAPWLPAARLCEGVRLEGTTVLREVPLEQQFAERELRARRRVVHLVFGSDGVDVTLADAELRILREPTTAALMAIGHEGTLWQRMRQARLARNAGIRLPIAYAASRSALVARLREFAQGFDRVPTDASMDLEKHTRTPDVPGRELDVEASVDRFFEKLPTLSAGTESALELVVRELKATVTQASLEDIDVTKVLASFETKYSIYKTGRAGNVELAAKKLNALVVPAGGLLSFNDRVGPRTVKAGFHQAPEIVGDELTNGIGGGTCQVSSTLYGAAMQGGLEVVFRRNHSRPSDYTTLGMDATVKYPEVDLRLRNAYRFSIVVHAFVVKPGTLRVELLGGEEVEKYQYNYSVSHVEPFLRRITEKAFLQAGKSMRKQHGTRGMSVHSTVVLRYRDGHSETRTFFSGYRATPEVFWVAPGFDRAVLPTLPEHAKGVEGELLAADDVYAG